MKFINLTAGILLITNRAPAFALALLANGCCSAGLAVGAARRLEVARR
jgi:hypothetical protein